MLITNIIIALLIGGIAGWLAGLIKRGEGFGLFGNIGIGIVGGILGSLLFSLLGVEDVNFIGSIFVSTVGAILILAIANAFSK